MIVKDEEAVLARCLESVKHLVDEIIIVDTGSTDATRDIAKSYGAVISEYPWDGSFANARNFSLQQAAMDWILIMDADDEFEKEDTEKLLKLISDEHHRSIYFFQTLSFMGEKADSTRVVSNMNVRLVKNHMGYHFNGQIHEQIVAATGQKGAAQLVDIRVYHYGYLESTIRAKNKRQRNISMIQKELDSNPDDPFMLFNMGTEYYALSDFARALQYYLKSYADFAPKRGYSPRLVVRIISCYDLTGQPDKMFAFIDEGLDIYPDFTDLEFLRGNKLLQTEKYLSAIKSLKKCLRMGEAPSPICYLVGAGSYKSHLLLSSVYQTLGESAQALHHCKMALKSNPTFQDAYCHYYRLLSNHKSADSIRKKLERFVPQNDEKGLLMLSDIFYTLQRYKWALSYARKARRRMDDPAAAIYDEGICLFYLRRYKAAAQCLYQVKDNPYAEKAAYFRVLCARFEDRKGVRIKRYANEYFVILNRFENLIDEQECPPLAEDAESSQPFIDPIFSLLDILLVSHRFEWFDKARQLLNLITDETVLMRLGKLYYKRGFLKLAYTELTRSIKLTDKIDAESLDIIKIVLAAEKQGEMLSPSLNKHFEETSQTQTEISQD